MTKRRRRAHLQLVVSLRDLEDAAMREGLSLDLDRCAELGVGEEFVIEWALGLALNGAERVAQFDRPDNASIKMHPDRAGEEFDRLASSHKILWYPVGEEPDDLCICPSSLIIRNARLRVVHDWSIVGLNIELDIPPVAFDNMDAFVAILRPGCFMAGLDIQDCFLH